MDAIINKRKKGGEIMASIFSRLSGIFNKQKPLVITHHPIFLNLDEPVTTTVGEMRYFMRHFLIPQGEAAIWPDDAVVIMGKPTVKNGRILMPIVFNNKNYLIDAQYRIALEPEDYLSRVDNYWKTFPKGVMMIGR